MRRSSCAQLPPDSPPSPPATLATAAASSPLVIELVCRLIKEINNIARSRHLPPGAGLGIFKR